MSVWLRIAAAATTVAALAVTAPTIAHANGAESLNEEGRELFASENYSEAALRFERAIEIRRDPRYLFNLCFTYYMMGQLDEAVAACDEVQPPAADSELIGKRDHVMGLIEKEYEEQAAHQPPAPAPDGYPADGDPADPGYPPQQHDSAQPGQTSYDHGSGYQPPERRMGPQLHDEVEIPHDYNWSLGFAFGHLRNMGLGDGNYRDGAGHLRAFGDFVLSSEQRLGLQAYGNFTRFNLADDAIPTAEPLWVADLGAAVFQHIPIAGNIYFTPLGGAHLSLISPDISDVAFGTLGVRGEASLNFIFGSSDQHVVSITPVAFNIYGPAGGGARGIEPVDFGLDRGSATYTFTAGYTMRFAEPFGGSLITLE